MSEIVAFLCGMLFTGIVAYFVFRSREAAARQIMDEKAKSADALVSAIRDSNARALEEKENTIREIRDSLRVQFANLAANILNEKRNDLSLANRTNLEAVLTPLKEQLQKLESVTIKAQSDHKALGAAMSKDVESIGRYTRELTGVAAALSNNTRIQGRTGEEILAEKLRQAGLEENVGFFLQSGTAADRPDATVCDPLNRCIVIDSKVTLTSFLDYEASPDGVEKERNLDAHIQRINEKIDQLARKKYHLELQKEFPERNYLPVTVMFMPYEAPLMVALRKSPSILQRALENNVVILTPLTLLAYLRVVYLAWQHEKEVRNQEEIIKVSRELLQRMNGYLKAFEEVGSSIGKLQESYEKAASVIVDGPNARTIVKSAKKLLDLGVKLEGRKGSRVELAGCLSSLEPQATGD